MDEQSTEPQDETPVTDAPQEPVKQDEQPVAETQGTATEVAAQAPAETVEAPAETPAEEVEEEAVNYQQPSVPQLDFNNLQPNEDGYIDPNALASQINQANAQTFEAARTVARNEYLEQRAEEKAWDRAYDKHPELKDNKELRDLVHRARLGEVTDMLSRTQDPSSVKLPTPSQVASKLFKHLATEKAAGVKQANENTVVQASAHVETAGRRTDDTSDSRSKAFQNINNSNKEVAKQARSQLLKDMLFSDK